MNDDFEAQLRAARLAAPSADLNRRMHGMFAASATQREPSSRPAWAMLGLPAAALTAALVLFTVRPASPAAGPRAPVIRQIEPQGLMRDLLLRPPAGTTPPPPLELGVRP